MNIRKIRNLAFSLHRYIGLAVGLILVIVGLTGSLLVFNHEIEVALIKQKYDRIIPQEQTLSLDAIATFVQNNYVERSDFKIHQFDLHFDPDIYRLRLKNSEDKQLEVFVNSHTGKVLGDRSRDTTFFSRIYDLHYALLAGDIGIVIVGIAALLMFLLTVTGLVLWNGWRNLVAGFKIKLNARIKRKNYDIHKVSGIVALVFLAMISISGFCWNFYEQTEPAIYSLTFSPKPPEVKSTPIGKKSLALSQVIEVANATIPEGKASFISVPTKPDEVFTVYMKQPEDTQYFANNVQIDRYSGEVLHFVNSRTASLGDRILNAFAPMHYGTFGGLPTRILYVFVGLSPTVLFITGLFMYRYRYRPRTIAKTDRELIER